MTDKNYMLATWYILMLLTLINGCSTLFTGTKSNHESLMNRSPHDRAK